MGVTLTEAALALALPMSRGSFASPHLVPYHTIPVRVVFMLRYHGGVRKPPHRCEGASGNAKLSLKTMQMQDKAVSFSFALCDGSREISFGTVVYYLVCWYGRLWYGMVVVCDGPEKPGMYLDYGTA